MTTTLPAATATTARPSTRAAWVLAALQLAYVGWFGVCIWVALARAAHFAGHLYIPYQGDPYTASADIWTGPWSWFSMPIMLTAYVCPFIAPGAALLSAVLLPQKHIRTNKVLFSVLLISALLVVATLVLAVLPAGRSTIGWILD
jgi:hypothetical protein